MNPESKAAMQITIATLHSLKAAIAARPGAAGELPPAHFATPAGETFTVSPDLVFAAAADLLAFFAEAGFGPRPAAGEAPEPHRIARLTAFIAVDSAGIEGIMGATMASGVLMPLIGSDESRLRSLVPAAEQISAATGIPYRVVEFTGRRDVTAEWKGATRG